MDKLCNKHATSTTSRDKLLTYIDGYTLFVG